MQHLHKTAETARIKTEQIPIKAIPIPEAGNLTVTRTIKIKTTRIIRDKTIPAEATTRKLIKCLETGMIKARTGQTVAARTIRTRNRVEIMPTEITVTGILEAATMISVTTGTEEIAIAMISATEISATVMTATRIIATGN